MAIKIKLLASIPALALALGGSLAQAKEIDTNIARMQAMDKITGMVRVINVPVNSEVKYGSFSIVVRACKTRPPEETPENFAFVDVVDNYKSENPVNIFRGWMISSSPSLNPVEHPIYDIWLLSCENGAINPNLKIMTAEELKAREQIPQVNTQAKNEPIDVENVPANLLNGGKEPVDATLANETPAPATETVATPNMVKAVADGAVNLQASDVQTEEAQIPAQSENTQGDGVPQALVNINTGAAAEPAAPTDAPQRPENVSAGNVQSDMLTSAESVTTEPTEINPESAENTAPANLPEMPLIPEDIPTALPADNNAQTAPMAAEDIELPEDNMLPAEEFEENGMLDDQLIDFSE